MQMKLFMHHLLTQVRVEVADSYDPAWRARPIRSPRTGSGSGWYRFSFLLRSDPSVDLLFKNIERRGPT